MIESYELVHIKTIITSVLRNEESIQNKFSSVKVFKRDRKRFKKDNQILIIEVTKLNAEVKLAVLTRKDARVKLADSMLLAYKIMKNNHLSVNLRVTRNSYELNVRKIINSFTYQSRAT